MNDLEGETNNVLPDLLNRGNVRKGCLVRARISSTALFKEVYDNYYKTFNPVKFDADAWCRMMTECGIRYAVPTGKHHDGFALWFSKLTPYSVKNTPFHRDIMKELGDACRRRGILFGSFAVICDGGNYEINLGPGPDGEFDPREEKILREAGHWFVTAHGEAIYGTRGGPWFGGSWGGSTGKTTRFSCTSPTLPRNAWRCPCRGPRSSRPPP